MKFPGGESVIACCFEFFNPPVCSGTVMHSAQWNPQICDKKNCAAHGYGQPEKYSYRSRFQYTSHFIISAARNQLRIMVILILYYLYQFPEQVNIDCSNHLIRSSVSLSKFTDNISYSYFNGSLCLAIAFVFQLRDLALNRA